MTVEKDNKEFETICREAIELHNAKNEQYQGAWRILGVEGLADNLNRKIARYQAIIQSNSQGESLRDTLMDQAIYCLMAIQLMDETGEDELHPCPFCGHLSTKKETD